MSEVIFYLLEASAILVVLFALYALLLRKLTFFSLNRFFLLAILTLSLVIPLLSFGFSPANKSIVHQPITELSGLRSDYYQAFDNWTFQGMRNQDGKVTTAALPYSSGKQWFLAILMIVYVAGFMMLIAQRIRSYLWINRLKNRNPHEVHDGVWVVKVPFLIAPFSFWNAVFVHEEALQDDAFQQILAHEKTHIDQWHSIDLLFVQLLAAVLWFNPVTWQLIKSLKATHEYIVDKQMIKQGYSLVEYQTLLLRQLISNNSYGLVHNFNLSFIKKRITMMKLKDSGWAGKARFLTAVTVAIVFSLVIVQCNSSIDGQDDLAQLSSVASLQHEGVSLPVVSETEGYAAKMDMSNSLTISISGNAMTINGQSTALDDLPMLIKSSSTTAASSMILEVDKSQKMHFVNQVQDVLRQENRRKILYQAISEKNEKVDLPMLLPPFPNGFGVQFPTMTDEYTSVNGVDIMNVKVGEYLGKSYQGKVYDFVSRHAALGQSNYVVSVKYEDDVLFDEYLTSLFFIYRGFDQLYDERAQQMFGIPFHQINKLDAQGREAYNAVRNNIPRAISIAEQG